MSLDPYNWRNQHNSSRIARWWIVVVLGTVLVVTQELLFADPKNPPSKVTILLTSVLFLMHTCLFGVLTINLIKRIVRNQDELVGITDQMRKQRQSVAKKRQEGQPDPLDPW